MKTLYIAPGSPWETGFNESFDGLLRDELLNGDLLLPRRGKGADRSPPSRSGLGRGPASIGARRMQVLIASFPGPDRARQDPSIPVDRKGSAKLAAKCQALPSYRNLTSVGCCHPSPSDFCTATKLPVRAAVPARKLRSASWLWRSASSASPNVVTPAS